jgi:hypothetical protein
VGAIFLLRGALNSHLLASMSQLGPDYCGSFEPVADTVDGAATSSTGPVATPSNPADGFHGAAAGAGGGGASSRRPSVSGMPRNRMLSMATTGTEVDASGSSVSTGVSPREPVPPTARHRKASSSGGGFDVHASGGVLLSPTHTSVPRQRAYSSHTASRDVDVDVDGDDGDVDGDSAVMSNDGADGADLASTPATVSRPLVGSPPRSRRMASVLNAG